MIQESVIESRDDKEFGVFYGNSLYSNTNRKKFLIDHILYEKDSICISSDPGIGKSILAIQMMANLTMGKPFLDVYNIDRPCNVLYFQTEGDRSETLERIKNMKHGLDIDDNRWAHINLPGICLNTKQGFQQFRDLLSRPGMKYDVIIIDPVYTTVLGDLSKADVATDWVRNLRSIRGEYKCSFICLHHENKEGFEKGKPIPRNKNNVIGSVFWGAFFNQTFKLRKHYGVHVLETGKQRSGKIIDKIEMKMLEPKPLMYVQKDNDLNINELKVECELKHNHDPMLARKIADNTQVSRATVYRILKKFQDNGKIMQNDGYYTILNGSDG